VLMVKERGERTLEDWRVRWRTVIVWSWAVTSLRFLGRLSRYEFKYEVFLGVLYILFLNPYQRISTAIRINSRELRAFRDILGDEIAPELSGPRNKTKTWHGNKAYMVAFWCFALYLELLKTSHS
jgi:hypothetical protein